MMVMKVKYILLVYLTVIIGGQSVADNMIIDDMSDMTGTPDGEYCDNKTTRWCLVTDQVMGGGSSAILNIKKHDDGFYLNMKGNVSTENNGGFVQIRTMVRAHPADIEFSGVRIRIKGNGQEYSVHVRTKYLFLPWQYYSAKFTASENWKTIDLSFSDFSPSNFYQFPKFSSKDITTIGIVAIGRPFKANIDVSGVEFY